MYKLFQYNWQVRNEWFDWCETLPYEELVKHRVGGTGSILKTLFHIVDVEYSWICDMKQKPDFQEPFEEYETLAAVKELSETFRQEIKSFLKDWDQSREHRIVSVKGLDGQFHTYTEGEILRHVIAHEIHHIGQLSIWSRDLGLIPVSANFINRGLR